MVCKVGDGMTPKEYATLRDAAAECLDARIASQGLRACYRAGADFAYDLMQKRVDELEKFIDTPDPLQLVVDKAKTDLVTKQLKQIQSLEAKLAIAKDAIKDFLDCSGDIEQNDVRLGWLKEALAQLEGKAE